MNKQFIVEAHGYLERALFYEYIHSNYKVKDINFDKEEMCHSTFPFVIDLQKKKGDKVTLKVKYASRNEYKEKEITITLN